MKEWLLDLLYNWLIDSLNDWLTDCWLADVKWSGWLVMRNIPFTDWSLIAERQTLANDWLMMVNICEQTDELTEDDWWILIDDNWVMNVFDGLTTD